MDVFALQINLLGLFFRAAQCLTDNLDETVMLTQMLSGELTELQLELPLDFPEAVGPVELVELPLTNIECPADTLFKA